MRRGRGKLRGAAILIAMAAGAFGVSPCRAEEGKRPVISVELGGGRWIADFGSHLEREGAYLGTPSLDMALFIPIGRHLGAEALIGSACVIHPYSVPIDGSFIYQQAGLWAGLELGRMYGWLAVEAGFEHGTLRVSEYSSGVAGCALGLRAPLSGGLSLSATLRFRRGFLQAVTIPSAYGIDEIDHPTSLSLTVGIAYSL